MWTQSHSVTQSEHQQELQRSFVKWWSNKMKKSNVQLNSESNNGLFSDSKTAIEGNKERPASPNGP